MEPVALVERLRLRRLPTPERAKAIRVAAGATQPEIAEAVGVHVITVARWEAGTRRPHGPAAQRYAQLLADLAKLVEGA
jgi:DNA-binding transcriptional regulator YiaG